MTGVADRLYERLPVPLQNAAVTSYGYVRRHRLRGGDFRRFAEGFAEREHISDEAWRSWQTRELRKILTAAWTAPFYRCRWGELGISEDDLVAFEIEDVVRLPTVTKEDVRAAPEDFCSGGRAPPDALTYYTSGSTGTPLTTYATNDDMRRGFALRDARYRGYAGVDYSVPRGTFSGRRVETDPDSSGPFHRYNHAERQVYFSPYHLGPETVARYVDALHRHRPRWLTGYAGAIHDLARLATEQGIELPRLDAVVTAAEPVSDRLREDVSAAFCCRVTEEYGLIEGVSFALECECGSLHVSPDAGFTEIVDDDDAPCPAGVHGELAATGFLRDAQLLVRYRTGDMATWRDHACPCGRSGPLLAGVEGRVDDVVVTPGGRRVGRLSTVPKQLPGVIATQFVQDQPNRVIARVVCDDVLRPGVADELRRRLLDRLGPGMTVAVEQVTELERTPSGKVRGVVRAPGSVPDE